MPSSFHFVADASWARKMRIEELARSQIITDDVAAGGFLNVISLPKHRRLDIANGGIKGDLSV
jgi:hypothetical protein